MRIEDNPFYVLDVKPSDNVSIINEKYDDKSFMDEDKEDCYDYARQVLISPNKRLIAELGWFYNLNRNLNEFLQDIENFVFMDEEGQDDFLEELKYVSSRESFLVLNEILNQLTTDEMANIIIEMDVAYSSLCSDDEIKNFIDDVNSMRRIAGTALCKDFTYVKKETKSLINNTIDAFSYIFQNEDDDDIITMVNEVASEAIECNHEYGMVIERLIDAYNLHFKSKLEDYKNSIYTEIEEAKEYTETYELEYLCGITRDFDRIAQPIQLLLKDRGQSDLQEESINIANQLRNLAIYYNNESDLPELSMCLIELEMELFSELPEIYSRLEEDKVVILDISKRKEIQTEIDGLDNRIVRDNESEANNKRYLMPRLSNIRNLIDSYTNEILKNIDEDSEEYADKALLIASYYRSLGCNCTWAGMWVEALNQYNTALYWARQSGNQDAVTRLVKDVNDVKRIINQEKQEKENAIAEKSALYYEGEWGLIFKDRVSFTPERIEYNGASIRIADITKVWWGITKKSVNGIPSGTDYNIHIESADKIISMNTSESVYNNVVDRLWKATATQIIKKILIDLRNGVDAGFGPNLMDEGIHYHEHNWFSKDIDRFYTWDEIVIGYGDGCMYFYDNNRRKTLEYFYFQGTSNLHMLDTIIRLAQKRNVQKLSDLL